MIDSGVAASRRDAAVLVSVGYWSWTVDARGEVDADADADADAEAEAILCLNDNIASLPPFCPFNANPAS